MDFWQVHGWLFLVCIVFFPRLTMLFAVATPFGWLAWLGWLITPRLLVAILATTYYWDTNPILCIFAWLNMLSAGSWSTTETVKVVTPKTPSRAI
jgi:hypothetical protein